MSACCRFLVSVPECQNILSPVYALLVARTQNYSQVFGGNPLLDVGLVVKYKNKSYRCFNCVASWTW